MLQKVVELESEKKKQTAWENLLPNMSKDDLIQHIHYLENRYEYHDKLQNEKWIKSWDILLGQVKDGEVCIARDVSEVECFTITQDELLEVKKQYITPAEWVDGCLNNYDSNTYPFIAGYYYYLT